MATDYSSESDFKYIEGLSAIPGIGPDLSQFTKEDKLEAAEVAESKLEADVNDGNQIGTVSHLHQKAASVYAAYWLFAEAEEPTTALSGQIVEGSSGDAAEFISRIENTYWDLVKSIENSSRDEGGSDFVFEVM